MGHPGRRFDDLQRLSRDRRKPRFPGGGTFGSDAFLRFSYGASNETSASCGADIFLIVGSGPVVVDGLSNQALDPDADPVSFDLTDRFLDPDDEVLTYSVTASDSAVLDATVDGATLTITPLQEGSPVDVVVSAEDYDGNTASFTFAVVVGDENDEPIVVNPIPDQPLGASDPPLLTDPNLDPLTYTVTPAAGSEAVFAATLTDDLLQIDGLSVGGPFDLAVTAEDPSGATATMTFAVVVFETNTPPALVLGFPNLRLALGQPLTFDVAKHVVDPDSLTGGALTYEASTGDPATVTVAVSGSALTLTPQNPGAAEASVNASDRVGASAGAAFTVTVGSGDGVTPIANSDRARTVADTSVVIDVLDNDTDPNGDGTDFMQIRSQPANGTATLITQDGITQDGITQVEYQPSAGFTGTDTFAYRYLDQANNWSNDAPVEVTVEAGPEG